MTIQAQPLQLVFLPSDLDSPCLEAVLDSLVNIGEEGRGGESGVVAHTNQGPCQDTISGGRQPSQLNSGLDMPPSAS